VGVEVAGEEVPDPAGQRVRGLDQGVGLGDPRTIANLQPVLQQRLVAFYVPEHDPSTSAVGALDRLCSRGAGKEGVTRSNAVGQSFIVDTRSESAIVTLVERTTRYVMLGHLPRRTHRRRGRGTGGPTPPARTRRTGLSGEPLIGTHSAQ
jgi:hypothetical protein